MANELTISASLSYKKGNDALAFSPAQKVITVAGNRRVSSVQQLSTTAEVVNVGEVSTPGYGFFQNLDGTNDVHLALDSAATNKFCTLKPGEFALFRPFTSTLYAVAQAGTPLLAFGMIDN